MFKKLFKIKDQNEKLLKNIESYEKKKAKQQESEVYAKNQRRGAKNKKENINVHRSS